MVIVVLLYRFQSREVRDAEGAVDGGGDEGFGTNFVGHLVDEDIFEFVDCAEDVLADKGVRTGV